MSIRKKRRSGAWTGIARSRATATAEALERRALLSVAIAAFAPQATFVVGPHPNFVTVADVNHDGKSDLVVADPSNYVGVLLGNGNGTFASQTTFSVGFSPIGVAAADVNGDGNLDLVTPNWQSNNLSVLLGNGDGTFQPAQVIPAGPNTYPRSVTVLDVSGDGKPDLVVANLKTSSVSVFAGNGDGTFQSPRTFAVGQSPISIAVADLNGDGKLDLAVANDGDVYVSVLMGNGDGTFGPQVTLAAMLYPSQVMAADVNGDGHRDLTVVNYVHKTIIEYFGDGAGGFGTSSSFAITAQPFSAVLTDVNGDGKLDLATVDNLIGANRLSVMLGNGDGTYGVEKTFATGVDPDWITAADVNADGRTDLVVSNDDPRNTDFSVSVLLGDVPPTVLSINRANPAGPIIRNTPSVDYLVTFNEPVTGVDPTDFQISTTTGMTAATPVAVSGSGKQYTVTVGGISGTGQLKLNLLDDGSIKDAALNPLQPGGAAFFTAQQSYAVGDFPIWVTPADLNGDGKVDLIVGNISVDNSSVSVLLGNGDGTFGPQKTFAAGVETADVAVGDLNGDGKPDLIVPNVVSNTVSVLLGNGDGTFQPQHTFATGTQPVSVAVADFNGDGRPDLGVADASGATECILLGNGDGTFQARKTLAAGSGAHAVVTADINGDGKADLVFDDFNVPFLSVLLGNGNGTFQDQRTFATAVADTGIAVADFNGDGRLDLVLPNETKNIVCLLLGNGNGTFQLQTTYATDAYPRGIVACDVNGDGKQDVVTSNYTDGTVSVLLGNGNGTFRPQQTFPGGAHAYSVAVADFNSDGHPDLAVAHYLAQSTITTALGLSTGDFVGQTYIVPPDLDTVAGTTGNDRVTLVQDPDGIHIDWTMGSTVAEVLIDDPNGLTINGGGGKDVIILDYTNGNPLPGTLHLNGTFTVSGMQGADPLAGRNLDIGTSTVFVSYVHGFSPIAVFQQYLAAGYNGGGWNGAPTPAAGVITSGAAAAGPAGAYGVGSADTDDNLIDNVGGDSIMLRYTLEGDTNLDGAVDASDAIMMARHYLISGQTAWDLGNFNYDATIDYNDALILQKNFGVSVPTAITPASAPSPAAPLTPTRQPLVQPVDALAAPVPPTPPPRLDEPTIGDPPATTSRKSKGKRLTVQFESHPQEKTQVIQKAEKAHEAVPASKGTLDHPHRTEEAVETLS